MPSSNLTGNSPLVVLLAMISAMLWSITYLMVIRQGWRDRTFAMPFLAMSINLSWEFLFTFLYKSGGALQDRVNFIWFILDLGILFTYLKFCFSYYPPDLPRKLMMPRLLMAVAFATVLIVAIVKQTGEESGSVYAAFADNLVMSVLFITMLVARGSRRGQSLGIAWAKLLGTAAASLSQYFYDPTNAIWNILFIEIFLVDLLYVFMLSRAPLYNAPERVATASAA